jgi:glyoxylase-like metal-dependent hydrolase (beta-lactamase superfamily II)
MIFIQVLVETLGNFAYLIGDEKTRLAAVVDPAGAVDRILRLAQNHGLKIIYIINTHSHSDHTSGSQELASATAAKIVMHKKARATKHLAVEDGDVISIGELKIKVIHTPGHSPDGMSLLVEDKLLTGDTLFVGECGRTDLPGGSSEELYDSLFGKLVKLEDELEVYPGHDYGEKPHSKLGYEKKHNYTLKPRSKDEFVKFMAED